MLLTGAFSEVLPQSEVLVASHLDMGDRDLFFSLKVSNLGNVCHLFVLMHLYKHLLLLFTPFSFSQAGIGSVFL